MKIVILSMYGIYFYIIKININKNNIIIYSNKIEINNTFEV